MKEIILKIILWTLLIGLIYINVGFWSLVLDIREDKRLDREIKKEKELKNVKR